VAWEEQVDWRAKVELFEQIRREYEFGCGTVQGVARKFGVHRRMVRQALANAVPPRRKRSPRVRPRIQPVAAFIDRILEADRNAPRKQRHTAHRIYVRIKQELASCVIAESTVRRYVREKKRELGLLGREVSVPQCYDWGEEAQVDWYEAYVEVAGERHKVQLFSMRSMASAGAFHRAYPRATQQAFLEAHELGFAYFGGVFRTLRYDNLSSAVKKVLRGYRREETARFIAFRSHWGFSAQFCTPGAAQEKGGVEGEVGYFRRNHLVPLPKVADFDELNEQLLSACRADAGRRITGQLQSVGERMAIEREHLLRLQSEGFELAEESFATVNSKGCVCVRTNWYSAPLAVGTRARVRVWPAHVEIWHAGMRVARHERCYSRRQQILELEHYLDVLERKPGALAGSKPLERWRSEGRWPESFDQLWSSLNCRQGRQAGTRAMIELLQLGRRLGYARLSSAIEAAVKLGCMDAAAVKYLLHESELPRISAAPLEVGPLADYERPLPDLSSYDQLLIGAAT
jgi:transposase